MKYMKVGLVSVELVLAVATQLILAPKIHTQTPSKAGGAYSTPMSFTIDPKELPILENEAKMGNNVAAYRLAYYYGLGLQDVEGQLRWLSVGANNGHLQSQRELGLMYVMGVVPGGKIKRNTQSGLYWWKKAAEAGQIDSMVALADYYEDKAYPLDSSCHYR